MSWTSGTAANYLDFVERLDDFLTVGHNLRPTYTGSGDGMLFRILGTAASVQETITVTFTSSTAFNVSGSVSGSLGSATVDAQFTSSVVSFYAVNLDIGDVGIWQPNEVSGVLKLWETGDPTGWSTGDTATFVMTKPYETVYKNLHSRMAVVSSGFTYAYQAFDHDRNTMINTSSLPAYVGCQFNVPIRLQKIAIQQYAYGLNYAMQEFNLEWSDDNTIWTVQQAFTNITWDSNYNIFDLGAPTNPHLYWRINIITHGQYGSTYISNVYFIEPGISDENALVLDTSARTEGEIVWKSFGDDGNAAIYTGLREMVNVSIDAYCWQTYIAADHDNLASLGLPRYQFRAMYGEMLTLRNDTIRYWFAATGSYFNTAANISTVYTQSHMGLLSLYSNSERFTYPLVMASNLAARFGAQRWSFNGAGKHQGFWCSDIDQSQGDSVRVILQMNDGNPAIFRACGNYSQGAVQPGRFLFNLNKNSDGSVPMFPIILMNNAVNSQLPSTFCAGQLQGIQHISGDGIVSEDIIIANRILYICLQGVNETGKANYVAYELS